MDADVGPTLLVLPFNSSHPMISLGQNLGEIAGETLNFYKIFKREQYPQIELKVKSHNLDTLFLEKSYKKDNLALGYILIRQIHGICDPKKFTDFLGLLSAASLETKGDLLAIEPILIAKGYDGLVDLFMKKYNEFESPSLHQAILTYIN